MFDVISVARVSFLVENIEQAAGSAGGGVDLVSVVHFGDLYIEGVIAKDCRGLAGEVEEKVHAGGEI